MTQIHGGEKRPRILGLKKKKHLPDYEAGCQKR